MSIKFPIPDTLASWIKRHGFDMTNVNGRIENGMTPLMQSALDSELEVMRILLTAGAEVNLTNDDDNNALWFACVSNQIMLVRELLHYGCNMNNQNVNGATALIYCSSTGKFDIVKELVKSGADIRKQTLDGFTALDSATTLPILKYLKPVYAGAQA